jgi:hypothetical protein
MDRRTKKIHSLFDNINIRKLIFIKNRATRENAQPIVEEIDKVLKKYRLPG